MTTRARGRTQRGVPNTTASTRGRTAPPPSNSGRYVVLLVILLVVFAVAVILLVGGQNTIKKVVVARSGAVGDTYMSDDEIIRASGLKLGDKINELDEIIDVTAQSVNALGYFTFNSLTRTGKHEVTLSVTVRDARAVVNAGGNLVLIDDKGYAMAHLKELPTGNIIYVDGVECSEAKEGRRIVTKRVKQIEDIISIVNAINDMGYRDVFTQLNVQEEHMMYLFTRGNLIVNFYTTQDIERTLELAKAIIDRGYTHGKIIISGNRASYIETQTQVNINE